jgi:hypothetical protein
MDQAALAPLEHFICLYPVSERHTNHIPFPPSGTICYRFQIVRSIPIDFQKVKGKMGQIFEIEKANYWTLPIVTSKMIFASGGIVGGLPVFP